MAGLLEKKRLHRERIGLSPSEPWQAVVNEAPAQTKIPRAFWEFENPNAPTTVFESEELGVHIAVTPGRRIGNRPKSVATNPAENLRRRLDNVNNHFRRNAGAVFNDEAALMLLARMYRDFVVQIADFDSGKNGIPLAKLTAANFCEIGENVIYITEAGQKFIASIEAYG